MPGMHLRQPRFTYSTCGPIRKKKERIQKFKEKRDSRYIAKNLKHDEYQRVLLQWLINCLYLVVPLLLQINLLLKIKICQTKN